MESTSRKAFHAGRQPPSNTLKKSVFRNNCDTASIYCSMNFPSLSSNANSPNKESKRHSVKNRTLKSVNCSLLIRASDQSLPLSSPPRYSTQGGSQIKPNWPNTSGLLLPSDNRARCCGTALSLKPAGRSFAVHSSRAPGCGYEKTPMLTIRSAGSFIIPVTKTRPSPLWPENSPCICGKWPVTINLIPVPCRRLC